MIGFLLCGVGLMIFANSQDSPVVQVIERRVLHYQVDHSNPANRRVCGIFFSREWPLDRIFQV